MDRKSDLIRRFLSQKSNPDLEQRHARKIAKLGILPSSLTLTQTLAAKKELLFREAMRKFKEPTVNFGKQKSKKYLRAYWKNRAIQERLARECFNEIEVQIAEIEASIPQSALEDPEVKAYLQEAINELRSLERRMR